MIYDGAEVNFKGDVPPCSPPPSGALCFYAYALRACSEVHFILTETL